jgi:probable DNA metabolism protein
VFYDFEQRIKNCRIVPACAAELSLFYDTISIPTDSQKAARVAEGIIRKCGKDAFQLIYKGFLSEQKDIESVLLACIRKIMSDPSQLFNYTDPQVLTLKQIAKQIDREVHRMHAFVRFQLTADNIYFAVIEPDFNVIPLIGEHFEKRYADQTWVIYDKRRNSGLHYDLRETQSFRFENSIIDDNPLPASVLNEKELRYQNLWKDYFDAVNIAARKNMVLHFKHVPKRYWKNLPEKYLQK